LSYLFDYRKARTYFQKVKFINADMDLSSEGDIAKVLYKEMKIPEAYKVI